MLGYHVNQDHQGKQMRRSGQVMSEEHWLESTDPQEMLTFLHDSGRMSERKIRLFAVACCRRVWSLLKDKRSRQALEAAERYADGLASNQELADASASAGEARDAAQYVARSRRSFGKRRATTNYAAQAFCMAVGCREAGIAAQTSIHAGIAVAYHSLQVSSSPHENRVRWRNIIGQEAAAKAILLRDIAGPLPFRQVPIEPSLLTAHNGLIANLAEAAYEHRSLPAGTLDPARLMILADAVEEGGGADELVAHLRSQQPHVRGCWAIDLLTGKS